MALNIATLNVRGLHDRSKCQRLADWFNSQKLDILCLQETYVANDADKELLGQEFTGALHYHIYGTNHRGGLAIILRQSPDMTTSLLSASDHHLSIQIHTDTHDFHLTNVYASPISTERVAFFDSLHQKLQPSIYNVVCGDFNTVLNTNLDRRASSQAVPRRAPINSLHQLLNQVDLIDLYRYQRPKDKEYTWQCRGHDIAERLDMILVSDTLKHRATNVNILPTTFSDHSAVLGTLQPESNIKRGRSRWQLNTRHLKDSAYTTLIENFWNHWRTQKSRFLSVQKWWDVGKANIRHMSQQYGTKQAKQYRHQKKKLQQAYEHSLKEMQKGTTSRALHNKITALQKRLKAMEMEDIRGQQIRSRQIWVEHGETSKRYFQSLEKIHGKQQLIAELLKQDGTTAKTTADMLSETAQFYEKLYDVGPTDVNVQEHLLTNLDARISTNDQTRCDQDLTIDELAEALQQLKQQKAAGSDGLPTEFYRRFWHILKQDLLEVYNAAYLTGRLTNSQATGYIKLIHKKGPRNNLKNWRPITILNTDYKILAKLIANRLKLVMPNIIGQTQTCTILDRSINYNCALIRDIIAFSQREKIPLGLISLDQEKAFDMVNWDYLNKTLETLCFGNKFRQWLRTLYTDIGSRVEINGTQSRRIALRRGVRQGCPISPMLYVIALEPLLQAIRKNPNIQGAPMPQTSETIKVIAYADDVTLFLSSNESFTALNHELTMFELATGSKINRQKSKGLWLGEWSQRRDKPLNITWTKIGIRILGIEYKANYSAMVHTNWRNTLNKVRNTLTKYSGRNLSYQGRATLIRQHVLSKVWYTARVLTIPRVLQNDLDKLIWGYFWRDATPLVKRSVCIRSHLQGGMSMPHLQTRFTSLRLKWFRDLLNPNDDTPWMTYGRHWMSHLSGIYKTGMHVLGQEQWHPTSRTITQLPPYYNQLLKDWQNAGGGRTFKEPETYESHLAEPLWGNPLIVDNTGRTLYYVSLARSGYSYVGDIYRQPPNRRTVSYTLLPILRSFIPPHWTALPPTTDPSVSPQMLIYQKMCLLKNAEDPVYVHEMTTRQIYYALIAQIQETPSCQKRWEEVYKFQGTENDWNCFWEKLGYSYDILLEAWDKDILWKLYHRVLPTKQRMHRWGLTDNMQCPACNTHPDTLDHCFYHCSVWQETKQHVFRSLPAKIQRLFPRCIHPVTMVKERLPSQNFLMLLMVTFWKYRTLQPIEISRLFSKCWRKMQTKSKETF